MRMPKNIVNPSVVGNFSKTWTGKQAYYVRNVEGEVKSEWNRILLNIWQWKCIFSWSAEHHWPEVGGVNNTAERGAGGGSVILQIQLCK
jgi:hypothetical protein